MRRTLASLVAAALAVAGLIVVPGASAVGTGPISINDLSLDEWNVNTHTFTFTISQPDTQPASCPMTIPWSTGGGTATPGSDYEARSASAIIAAGASSVPVLVTVFGDTTPESDETFDVVLGTPTVPAGSPGHPCTVPTVADGTGVGTIVNDDGGGPSPSALSINDVRRSAGACTFTVSLAPSSASPVTVDFATADADGDARFTPTSGTLTFAPGDTSRNVIVSNVVKRRRRSEFEVNLSGATGASITDASGTCSIPRRPRRA